MVTMVIWPGMKWFDAPELICHVNPIHFIESAILQLISCAAAEQGAQMFPAETVNSSVSPLAFTLHGSSFFFPLLPCDTAYH